MTTIDYESYPVSVSDERKEVTGAAVTITLSDGRKINGDVIPMEGDCPSCWMGRLYYRHYVDVRQLTDALADVAQAGAAGKSGTVTIE